MAAQQFNKGPVPGASGSSEGNTVTVTLYPGQHDRVTGSVYSDKAGTLFIQQSGDGQNWDINTSYSVDALDGTGFSEEIILAYVRVRFENTSGADTTEFRLFARTTAAGSR